MHRLLLPALAALAVLSAPAAASATAAATLGTIFNDAQQHIRPVLAAVFLASGLVGLWLTARGLFALRDAADSGGTRTTYSDGLMKLAAGAFLVSLAGTLAVGWATIGSPGNFGVDTIDQMQTGQAPTAGCALVGTIAGGIAAIGGGPLAGVRTGAGVSNATCAAANFAISAAGPLTTLILATCVLIGVVLVATALVGFANLGKPGSKDTPGGLIGRFAAGVLLTNIYWLMDVASQSLGMAGVRDLTTLGTQAQGILSYSASTANPVQHLATVCGLALVALVPFGVWSFAKGVLMMRDAVEQRAQVSVGQGVTFVVGGVCLANMNALLPMVLSTFGAPGGLYC